MMETPSSDDLYDRLMALNHDAMEAEHFEIAYYTLMAAMHRASTIGADDLLVEIAATASEQRALVDDRVSCPIARSTSSSQCCFLFEVLFQ